MSLSEYLMVYKCLCKLLHLLSYNHDRILYFKTFPPIYSFCSDSLSNSVNDKGPTLAAFIFCLLDCVVTHLFFPMSFFSNYDVLCRLHQVSSDSSCNLILSKIWNSWHLHFLVSGNTELPSPKTQKVALIFYKPTGMWKRSQVIQKHVIKFPLKWAILSGLWFWLEEKQFLSNEPVFLDF